MKRLYLTKDSYLNINEPLSVAVGFFDGLHLGHLSLVEEAKDYALKHDMKSALMTFSPNPSFVLGFIKEDFYITDVNDRKEILEELGIDYLIEVEFTKDVASLDPKAFIDHYIVSQNVKHVVCGFDFTFGKFGKGNANTLRQYASSYEVSEKPAVRVNGEKVSSTLLRNLIKEGRVKEAAGFMTRYYRIKGTVSQGRHIGHNLGFPTANVDYHHYLIPKRGVYSVKVKVDDKLYLGMCNIGYNPTFTSLEKLSLEVHIFDFNQNLYGKEIEVYFYDFIRDEQTFSHKEDLIAQLNKDKERILNEFATYEVKD